MGKTFQEINEKIKNGEAVVVTAEELVDMAKRKGVKKVAKEVDVVTTATFGPMCSSGALLNFGHSDPPIKMQRVWLNDVPAYAGLAAVDAYIGATELSETRGMEYGGAHVIEDLVSKKRIRLRAIGYGTDCYPRRELDTYITLDSINQAILFNPRNAYQNYAAAANSSERTLYTYMGVLLPKLGNVNYSTCSELSPLIKDPLYRTIGIGTRIFLGGGVGYVAWHGTQHNPLRIRDKNTKIPIGPAGTLCVIGNLKGMSPDFLRAATFHKYGVTMFVGIGIPIPLLDEEMAYFASLPDEQIYTNVVDYGVASRERPVLAKVSYKELKSGEVRIGKVNVPTAPLSSLFKARQIAEILKTWIKGGKFFLQEPVERLPLKEKFGGLEIRG